MSTSNLPPKLLVPATTPPHFAVERASSAPVVLLAVIPVLACVVLAASAMTAARVEATSVRVLPDVDMHLSPLALEGLFTD